MVGRRVEWQLDRATARRVALRLEQALRNIREANGIDMTGCHQFHLDCAAIAEDLYKRLLDPIYDQHPGLDDEVWIVVAATSRREGAEP